MSRLATSRPRLLTSRRPTVVRQPLLIAVVGVVVLLAAAAAWGGVGALTGAALGLLLVAIFLITGRLPFLVSDQLGRGVAFLVLGINYLFRVVLLLVALIALQDRPWLDARALGLTVIIGALAWNALVLRRHLLAVGEKDADRTMVADGAEIAAGGNTMNSAGTSVDADDSAEEAIQAAAGSGGGGP